MKTLVTSIVISAFVTASALAISLPVAEDTFTSSAGALTPANGKAPMLTLNANQAALLQFDLVSLPAQFNTTNIVSARLKIYIVNARNSGDLVATSITSPWTEAVVTNTPMPTSDSIIIGTAPAAKIQAKRFVTIDVTSAVAATLNVGGSGFGFMLRDTSGQTSIASKEGPGLGPAAQLEIDANLALDAAGSSQFPGSLTVGTDLKLAGLLRQGSETGTAEPAGRGLIIRRIQSTNSTLGSIVARTDTLTLERDGTTDGWRIVNSANPGQVVVSYIIQFGQGQYWDSIILANPSTRGTNQLYNTAGGANYLRCTFGNPFDLGHQTEVSLSRSPDNTSPNWVGTVISSYNQ
ncbi:MAG: hypothetical protein C5B50_18945 [Verrucomicrobia bacterium]|nr:MAG: hypothetical protein C5B50_18945 [Verrucomicrobiota bacterium]